MTSDEPAGGVRVSSLCGSAIASRSRSCASAHRLVRLGHHPLGLLGRHLAFGNDALGELRPHRRVIRDRLRHERLRVRRFVLLVVTEAAVADEIDDHVVPEALAEGHRQPRRRHGGLRVVGVHVDDRRVETLREVARVARGTAFRRVGCEPDLVVRDQVERAAGGVAGKPLEVERLGHDALSGKRRVAVDENRQRDGRAMSSRRRRAVGLIRARPALDDRIHGLEVTGVRDERDGDRPSLGLLRPLGAKVVLHVAGATLRVADDGVRRPFSLELAEDRLVRLAERVGEHAEAAAVGHADDGAVRALASGELDRLVEHWHQRVQPFDRELFLAEERAAEVLLERLDSRQPLEKAAALLRRERLAELAGLDRPAQPPSLLVVGDVLDLVRHRPAVRLLEQRQCLGQRLGGNMEAEQRRRDLAGELGRERVEAARVELGVADRLRAQRVETRREVAVRAIRVDETRSRGHGCQELGRGDRRRRLGGWRWRGGNRRCLGRGRWSGLRRRERGRGPLGEQLSPFLRHRLRVLQIVVEQRRRVGGVEPVDLGHGPRLPARGRATRAASR